MEKQKIIIQANPKYKSWFYKKYRAIFDLGVVIRQSEQLKSKKCGMCGIEKEDDGHNCCEDCGGIAF